MALPTQWAQAGKIAKVAADTTVETLSENPIQSSKQNAQLNLESGSLAPPNPLHFQSKYTRSNTCETRLGTRYSGTSNKLCNVSDKYFIEAWQKSLPNHTPYQKKWNLASPFVTFSNKRCTTLLTPVGFFQQPAEEGNWQWD